MNIVLASDLRLILEMILENLILDIDFVDIVVIGFVFWFESMLAILMNTKTGMK